MRTVYSEPNTFKAHTSQNVEETLIPFETDFFDDKCDDFVEGHRAVPEGCWWTRDDGKMFSGKMITPWKDSSELDATQRKYERQKLADAENALAILLGGEST